MSNLILDISHANTVTRLGTWFQLVVKLEQFMSTEEYLLQDMHAALPASAYRQRRNNCPVCNTKRKHVVSLVNKGRREGGSWALEMNYSSEIDFRVLFKFLWNCFGGCWGFHWDSQPDGWVSFLDVWDLMVWHTVKRRP